MGLTFKEIVPDLRNCRVVDVIGRLKDLGHEITIVDPMAEPEEARNEYGLELDPDEVRHSVAAVPPALVTALLKNCLRWLLRAALL